VDYDADQDLVLASDISDPTSPTEIACFVPPAGHNPVCDTGLWILRVTI
jgi:hypothetical protein